MAKKTSSARSVGGKKYFTVLLVGTGLLLFAVSGFFGWSRVYQDPERVFRGMLSNSLSTGSVTRQVTQAAQGNSLEQYIRLSLGAPNRSRIISTIGQGTGEGASRVTTESIGTPEEDYTRYTAIDTDQTTAEGQKLDFSNILDVWGKSGGSDDGQGASARYLNEALLGVVPFGALSAGERQALLELMQEQNVFATDYDLVTRASKDRRKVYVYKVTVEPKTYVTMLQKFTKALGVKPIDGLDQQSYEGVPPLEIELTVDVLSRQLTRVNYLGNGRQESYSGHGLQRAIVLPDQTIPLAELQSRLQTVR